MNEVGIVIVGQQFEKRDIVIQENRPCSQCPEHPTVSGGEERANSGASPYSPDLAPCDFFLFPKLKEVIKRALTTELRRIPEEAFRGCIKVWKKRLDKCVRLEGNYFEGDKL